MNISVLIPNENWVCDKIGNDFKVNSSHTVSFNDPTCDLFWLLSPWLWNLVPKKFLENNFVVCTVHHIVPEKFNVNDFLSRDKYVDAYHVPCEQTKNNIYHRSDSGG